jgi:molecular chaperone GrpE
MKKQKDEKKKIKKQKEENKKNDKLSGNKSAEENEIKTTGNENEEFKPVEELDEDSDEQIKELENEVAKLKERLLRKVAEFENYKKRTENDQYNLIKYAAESFILNILPVYDDLNRSLSHIDEPNNTDSIKEGLKLVLDKFSKVLEEQGIKKIDTIGKEFDFNYHDALLQQPSNDVPANTILEEVEPGYMYKDKVIRHAKVIVSQEIEESKPEVENSTEEQNSLNEE